MTNQRQSLDDFYDAILQGELTDHLRETFILQKRLDVLALELRQLEAVASPSHDVRHRIDTVVRERAATRAAYLVCIAP